MKNINTISINFLLILIDICTTLSASAQPTEEWTKRYDGINLSGNLGLNGVLDQAKDIAVDDFGNVYVLGRTDDQNHARIGLIKYNSAGEQQWVSIFEHHLDFCGYNFNYYRCECGTQYDNIFPQLLRIGPDGNIYITGYGSITYQGGSCNCAPSECIYNSQLGVQKNNIITLKYSPSGILLDTSTYHYFEPISSQSNEIDRPHDMVISAQGNIYIVGESNSGPSWCCGANMDMLVLKYNSNLQLQWARRYDGPANKEDKGVSIAVDLNENIYVTGSITNAFIVSNGWKHDIETVKYNSSGDSLWTIRFNSNDNQDDYAQKIMIDASGNIYIAGNSKNCPNGSCNTDSLTFIKYDNYGNTIWIKKQPDGTSTGNVCDLVKDINGNFFITDDGGYYFKFDSNGDTLWRISSPIGGLQEASTDANGNFYVDGSIGGSGAGNGADYAITKISPTNGEVLWLQTYDGPGHVISFQCNDCDDDRATKMALDHFGNVYVTGMSHHDENISHDWDIVTIKYCQGSINANAGPDATIICAGSSIQLNANGGNSYHWEPQTGLSDPNIPNPVAAPLQTTTYTVTVKNGTGCNAIDSAVVNVNSLLSSNWSNLNSHTNAFFESVSFSDASQGVVVGGDSGYASPGIILQTNDYGNTWTNRTPLSGVSFLQGVSLKGNKGIAVGFGGTVLSTSDGGITWTQQNSGTSQNLNDVSMGDNNSATAVGWGGVIIHSNNGGINWTNQISTTSYNLNEVVFTDANNGTAVGDGGIILRTIDGGANWISQASSTSLNLHGAFFLNTEIGVVVGAGSISNQGTIQRTDNSGATWLLQQNGLSGMWNVFFTDSAHGYVVGNNGTVLYTANAGQTWSSETSITINTLFDICFPTSTIGYAVGSNGTILKKVVQTLSGISPALGAISGSPVSLCAPSVAGTGSYSVNAVEGANSYIWTGPQGMNITSGQNTSSINVAWTSNAINNGIIGQVCVTAYNNCGQTLKCMDVNLNVVKPVQPNSISGPAKVCPGENVVYSVAPVSRASDYTWNVPVGMGIVSGQGTNLIHVNITAGYSGGTVSVTANNACGTGNARSRNVSLNSPLIPGSISGQTSGVCNMSGVIYSISPIANANSYFWTVTGGNIQGSNIGTSITVNWNSFSTGTVSVIVNNGCGSSAPRILNVAGSPAAPGPIAGESNPCVNSTHPYSVNTVTGSDNYIWTSPAGTIISNQGNKLIDITYGGVAASNQTLSVKASNFCGISSLRLKNGIIIVACQRILDNIPPGDFKVYPNPAKEELNVSFTSEECSTYAIRLIDVNGRVVFNQSGICTGVKTFLKFDVYQFAKGMYAVQLITDEKISLAKVLIE